MIPLTLTREWLSANLHLLFSLYSIETIKVLRENSSGVSMATHHCAKFVNGLKLSHERTIRRVYKLLSPSWVPCWCRLCWKIGNWWQYSDWGSIFQSWFIISYAGCPIHWWLKLLLTSLNRIHSLFMAIREVLPFWIPHHKLSFSTYFRKSTKVLLHCMKRDNRRCIRVCSWELHSYFVY